jgi:hypothetical protein
MLPQKRTVCPKLNWILVSSGYHPLKSKVVQWTTDQSSTIFFPCFRSQPCSYLPLPDHSMEVRAIKACSCGPCWAKKRSVSSLLRFFTNIEGRIKADPNKCSRAARTSTGHCKDCVRHTKQIILQISPAFPFSSKLSIFKS